MKSLSQPDDNQVDLTLKNFKSNFVRNFVSQGKGFNDNELSTALLIVAFHCLLEAAPYSIFRKRSALTPTTYSSLSDADWLSFCLRLYEMVLLCCPMEETMPPPDLQSIGTVRTVMTPESWRSLGRSVSSIGFTYEILGLAARKQALSATQTANKELAIDQLIAFTQLYTPDWVVDFLTANTILPLLDEAMSNEQSLDRRYGQWLLPQNGRHSLPGLKKRKLQELKLIDPACGSGQFLLSSFDLFYGLYKAAGIDSSKALHMVLFDNLYGADIDKKAIWVTSLGLLVKSLLLNETITSTLKNLFCSTSIAQPGSSDLLGSISPVWLKEQDHVLNRSYDAVVTNPPYIGRKSLSRELKISLKQEYPRCGADICAAFLERSMGMLAPGGRMGMITQSSLLTLPSYQDLRRHLLARYHFDSVIQCGTGVFPRANGEKIDSVLLVAEAPAEKCRQPKSTTTNCDLRALTNHFVCLEKKQNKSDELKRAVSNIARSGAPKQKSIAWVQKRTDNLALRVMQSLANAPALSSIAQVKQGLATTDNQRFVRSYWDVPEEDLGSVWVPYIKGAGSERWYSDNNFVVKWGKDGSEIKQAVIAAYPYLKGKCGWVVKNEQFYFKPGLCFSFINKHHLAVRRLPAGSIFDVASSAIFPSDGEEDFLLAYLNSSLLSTIANLINPTINLQVGDIKRLPMPSLSLSAKEKLSQLARLCYEKKLDLKSLWSNRLTQPFNNSNHLNGNYLSFALTELHNKQAKLRSELKAAEAGIDELVLSSFAKLDYLKMTDLKELSLRRAEVGVPAKCDTDERTFAARILLVAASQLMQFEQSERTTILPFSSDTSVKKIFGINGASALTFETMLGLPLTKHLAKSKVADLSKQAKTSSRYFSVFLPESKALMLLSVRSLKSFFSENGKASLTKSLKVIEQPSHDQTSSALDENSVDYGKARLEANDILKRVQDLLQDKVDWTSSELLAALKASTDCR